MQFSVAKNWLIVATCLHSSDTSKWMRAVEGFSVPTSTTESLNNSSPGVQWKDEIEQHVSVPLKSSSVSEKELYTSDPRLTNVISRHDVVRAFSSATTAMLLGNSGVAFAFDGGVGGLGKTKPETGVKFWGNADDQSGRPVQSKNGVISAELVGTSTNGDPIPIMVQFQSPWNMLTTSGGLEARDLQTSESAFVQVIINLPAARTTGKKLTDAITKTVFGSKGKFGAYGAPIDIKYKRLQDDGASMLYSVSFVSFTPAMRESERKALLKLQWVGDGISPFRSGGDAAAAATTLVILVVGTTLPRFSSKEKTLDKVANSLVAVVSAKSS